MCHHKRTTCFCTLSFIKIWHLKVLSNDPQCKLEIRKPENNGITIENAARNFAHIYIYKIFR